MSNKKQQYIYMLKLIPSLLHEENWTDREEEIVDRHFAKLQALLHEGKLILAGKTAGLDEHTFGLVIVETESLDEALGIMNSDPAIVEGIMQGDLFPYHVALIRQ